ncbi:MAG: GTP-binding protein [Bacteroidota bacterium]
MNTSRQKAAQPSRRIPVVILNGFLGSGKTTLFRNLLTQSGKKNLPVYAVVNDMSELDVDGELIGGTGVVENNRRISESIHGCVLSSKKGIEKLDAAIAKLLTNPPPDLIIVETSGSCHPMPLIEYFQSQSHLKLIGVLVLADSLMLAHDYQYGQQLVPRMQQNLREQKRDMVNLLIEQIMFCSHLILTKADRIPREKLHEIANFVQPINPYVSILSVRFGNLDIETVLAMPEYDYHRVGLLIEELKPVLEAEFNGDRPYNIATRVIKDHRPFDPQRLWEVCHRYLDQGIYRSKGFFWLSTRDKLALLWNQAAGSINLEIVGQWRSGIVDDPENGLSAMEVELLKKQLAEETGRFGDRYCNLTVIGDKTQVDRFTLALRSCFLTEEEIRHWEARGEFADPWPKNIVKLTS